MTKIQESSFHFWPCYYVGLLCDNMMWFDYVTSTGLLLPRMLFRYYFSGVVLINYLASGMLQINMIWQNVVRPRQYINNGDTIFLTQLWVLVRCQMFINIYIKGYIASQAILRQCCFHFCLQYYKSWLAHHGENFVIDIFFISVLDGAVWPGQDHRPRVSMPCMTKRI